MSLYLKYRPKTLDELRGNSGIASALDGMLTNKETCPHSFLLHGPTGCGKTTLGRIIAKGLGAVGSDFREIDSADFRGIDSVREIRKLCQFSPMQGEVSIWLLDEIHKMTGEAQNALLKILEDPPGHVYFILCTTEPQKLLPTIRGRCSQFQIEVLNDAQLLRLLKTTVREEGESLEEEIYEQIIQDSLGHPRNALQILEQVLHADPEQRLAIAKQTAEEQSQSIELCRALLSGANWKVVSNILTGLKTQEPEGIRRQVLGYAQAVLLKADNEQAGLILEEFMEPNFTNGFPQLVFSCYSVIKN